MKLNISNLLTLARVIVIPLIVFCIYMNSPFYGWTAFTLFCLASITDYFDGYIARIRNEVTNFGTFLDPIADKLLVAAVILILTSKEQPTSVSYIIHDPSGTHIIFTSRGANGYITENEIPYDEIKNTDFIYMTSLGNESSKLIF